jgi:hypothetical protein
MYVHEIVISFLYMYRYLRSSMSKRDEVQPEEVHVPEEEEESDEFDEEVGINENIPAFLYLVQLV